MAAAATAEKSSDDPVAMWTLDELVAILADNHEIVVSRSQLGKILAAMDIDLRKVRGWLNRRHDPEFWSRVRDVCGLYLNPPEQAIALSVYERPGSKPKNASPKTNPPDPDVRDAENSNTSVMASRSWSLHWTSALARCSDTIPRNDSDIFCAFLETIEAAVDPG